MPQGRIVLKAICQSKKLSCLKTDGARLLYTWLIPNVDVNGCFSGDPEVIKGQIFTRLKKSTKTIESYLDDLDNWRLVRRYSCNGDEFLQIPDFAHRQPSINPDKEAKPTIPLPTPDQLQSNSRPTLPQVKESKVKESKGIGALAMRSYSEFEIFWKAFKGRWNVDKHRYDKGGKKEALIEWKNLTAEQQTLAIQYAGKTGDKFTKDACRWLKGWRWQDFMKDPVLPPKAKPPKEVAVISAEKKATLRKTLPTLMQERLKIKEQSCG